MMRPSAVSARIGIGIRWLMCLLGLHHLARWKHRTRLLIVCYHGITDEDDLADRYWHLTRRSAFHCQLRYLKKYYEILPIDVALERLWSGGLRGPAACLTFDDGYRSNRILGLPVLQQLEVPATIYLTTSLLGTTRTVWTVELAVAFQTTEAECIDTEPLPLGTLTMRCPEQRARACRVISEELKRYDVATRDRILRRIYERLGLSSGPDASALLLMDWHEAKEMERSGLVTFGAHSATHPILAVLDDTALDAEVTESIAAVHSRIGALSSTFAYPNGGVSDFDSRAIRVLQRRGIRAALSTIEGLNSHDTDPFKLRRITVGSDTTFDQFRLLTSGVIPALRRLLGTSYS